MNLYNTKTGTIEPLKTHDDKELTMYTCGPTVYHYAHIGNLRCYIMEDILEKTLNYIGYNVKRCMNITDVGHLSSDGDTGVDKMVKGAEREHKTVLEIAQFYTDKFFEDCAKLNIKKPEIVSKATDNIDEYIKIINRLLEKGYAYKSGDNIYFDTSKLDEYYTLTNHDANELLVGVRDSVTKDEFKKNQNDFVLWFTKSKFSNQELKWNSPFGYGYPGWHIECSGISLKYLGEYLDIHCGGVDNIFPHHTNEIAQSEAYLGHKWCNTWFHVEHLNDKFGKMSKSKGDFLSLDYLIEKGYNPLVYRLFCLNSHYRSQLLFAFDSLDSTKKQYDKLIDRINNIPDEGIEEIDKIKTYQDNFKQYLMDDLNTANAMTVLYDVIKDDNLSGKTKRSLIKDFDKVLSLDLIKEVEIDDQLKNYALEKIEERKIAKENKDYAKADLIREELASKGIIIKDTKEGTMFSLKQ